MHDVTLVEELMTPDPTRSPVRVTVTDGIEEEFGVPSVCHVRPEQCPEAYRVLVDEYLSIETTLQDAEADLASLGDRVDYYDRYADDTYQWYLDASFTKRRYFENKHNQALRKYDRAAERLERCEKRVGGLRKRHSAIETELLQAGIILDAGDGHD